MIEGTYSPDTAHTVFGAMFTSISFYMASFIYICLDTIAYRFYLFVLRFYGPVNTIGSCRAQSVYLTTSLLGRLSLRTEKSIYQELCVETTG